MDDGVRVGVGDGGGELQGQLRCLRRLVAARRHGIRQHESVKQFHRNERALRVVDDFVDLADVRMCEFGCMPRLACQTSCGVDALVGEDFDCGPAAGANVGGLIHLAGPARAYARAEPIAATDCSGEPSL